MEQEKKEPGFIEKIILKFTKKSKRTFGIWFGLDSADSAEIETSKKDIDSNFKKYLKILEAYMENKGIAVEPDTLNGQSDMAAMYLWDFYSGAWNKRGPAQISLVNEWQGQAFGSSTTGTNPTNMGIPTITADSDGSLTIEQGSNSKDKDQAPKKIKAQPKDVKHELELPITPLALEHLDAKIALVEKKLEFIKSNHYSKEELTAIIERLKNRKQYNGEIESFFAQLRATNDEKIQDLLEKYDLRMDTSDLYVPEFPEEAITIMDKYTEHCKTLCDKKPVFYVIATSDYFKVAFKQRDPILLAQSPFGFYWYILGAWDKELIFLPEL